MLVTAAAGGIGSLLVQAARSAGARVIGAAGGPEKVAHVHADLAVDYNEPGWTDALGEVTVALDGVGGELGRGALERLAVGGRLILFGYASGAPTQFDAGDLYRRGLTVSAAIGPRILNRPGGIRELEERALAAAADGTLTPALTRFPLADAAAAHAALESRATTGKVVLIRSIAQRAGCGSLRHPRQRPGARRGARRRRARGRRPDRLGRRRRRRPDAAPRRSHGCARSAAAA